MLLTYYIHQTLHEPGWWLEIRQMVISKTKNVIYLAFCKKCNQTQYVGKVEVQGANKCINLHRNDSKNTDPSPSTVTFRSLASTFINISRWTSQKKPKIRTKSRFAIRYSKGLLGHDAEDTRNPHVQRPFELPQWSFKTKNKQERTRDENRRGKSENEKENEQEQTQGENRKKS